MKPAKCRADREKLANLREMKEISGARDILSTWFWKKNSCMNA